VSHIGNEPGDLGYGFRLLESAEDDLHLPVIVFRELVVSSLLGVARRSCSSASLLPCRLRISCSWYR
jgi:hypothetical protein